MSYMITKMYDGNARTYWTMYEHGNFHDPVAIIDDRIMREMAKQVLGLTGGAADIEDLGKALREWRYHMKWTQQEVADSLGISRNYISQIERGVADNMSLKIYLRLRNLIGE